MPFLLFLKNLAANSHFIMNSETGILRVFLTSDDGVVSDKYLADEGNVK